MIQELKQKIDQSLKIRHSNPWADYSKAKRVITDYETEHRTYFPSHEWSKYINYITDELEI